MMSRLIIVLPFITSLLSLMRLSNRQRSWLLPVTGCVHFLLSLGLMLYPPAAAEKGWIGFDSLSRALLPYVSLLFFVCSAYGVPYLQIYSERQNRGFVSGLLALLGLMSLALQARHLGLLWIAMETGTLVTVPLLHFSQTPRSYEATWKYLLVGGTGIALSLLGTFFLGYASLSSSGGGDLTFTALVAAGEGLSRPWIQAGWILLLAGYGTKMGLAPMHTWKPDAYGEAPGIVGALLAGGLTTVAFSGLLRVQQVVSAAGEGVMASRTWLCLGLFSMFIAAFSILGIRNFKRMLAFSSIEHMGILSVGAALGGAGLIASLFHVWANGITKGALFLSAGNMRRVTGNDSVEKISGLSMMAPWSARIFVAGIFAVTACPPFAPFFSEIKIIRATFVSGSFMTAACFLFCLLIAFFGLTQLVFKIADGRPPHGSKNISSVFKESRGVLIPPFILLVMSVYIGLFTPQVLLEIWTQAAVFLGIAQ